MRVRATLSPGRILGRTQVTFEGQEPYTFGRYRGFEDLYGTGDRHQVVEMTVRELETLLERAGVGVETLT